MIGRSLNLIRCFILATTVALIVALVPRPVGGERIVVSAPPMRVVGYLASWGVRSKGTAIAKLPARHLTHIFYAFADIGKDGTVTLSNACVDIGACGKGAPWPGVAGGNFGELKKLKARFPHLRLAISIGGWAGSARFSDAAPGRQTELHSSAGRAETRARRPGEQGQSSL
jgi:chitinase